MSDTKKPNVGISKSDTAGNYGVGNHGRYFSAAENERMASRYGFSSNTDIDSNIGNAALFFELRIANEEQSANEIRSGLKKLHTALENINEALTNAGFAKAEAIGQAQNAPSDAKIRYWLTGLHKAVRSYGKPLERLIPPALDALSHGKPGRIATAEPRRSLIAALVTAYEENSGRQATVTTDPISDAYSGPALSFVTRCLARIRAASIAAGASKDSHCLSVSIATIATDMKRHFRQDRTKGRNPPAD